MTRCALPLLLLALTSCSGVGSCAPTSQPTPIAEQEQAPSPAARGVVRSCCGGCDDPGCESCRGVAARGGCRDDETPALCGDPADGTTCRSSLAPDHDAGHVHAAATDATAVDAASGTEAAPQP